MLKTLITLLAVVGFVSTSMAQARRAPVKTEAQRRAEIDKEKPKTPKELARDQARQGNTAAKDVQETREVSKTELTVDQKNIVSKMSEEGQKKVTELLSKINNSTANNHETFLAENVIKLIKEASSRPASEKEILRFIEESFTLMTIGGEPGMGARKAINKLASELSRGARLDDAIYSAVKEAFPKLTDAQLKEKIEEFKRSCLGQA